jgi:hypothetical protein
MKETPRITIAILRTLQVALVALLVALLAGGIVALIAITIDSKVPVGIVALTVAIIAGAIVTIVAIVEEKALPLVFAVCLVAILFGSVLMIVTADRNMQYSAASRASRIAQHTWTKVSTTPLTSWFYPNGNGSYLVRLSSVRADANDPCYSLAKGEGVRGRERCREEYGITEHDGQVADETILVVSGDPRGAAILAIPDGSRVLLNRADGQSFGSRMLTYNYLQPRLSSDSDQKDFNQ